jgi:hypothetical protein
VAKKLTPENIGTALGRLANRVDAWKKQRDELIAEGERLAHIAASYVHDLRGHGETGAAKKAGKNKGGRPKGMKMSEATKAKLRAAWKRRKALAAEPMPSAPDRAATRKRRARG